MAMADESRFRETEVGSVATSSLTSVLATGNSAFASLKETMSEHGTNRNCNPCHFMCTTANSQIPT